ncbi:hypothetical protein SteCoe_22175 [Stentor coeruleus]|uniref:Uncharacterized protein n=1 Tax=Stentor coeruleus TaxID=5963 RepID=A0A1R2BMW7_9CILI|nr:hypothetical protein SteCoe_22175 [Stentor coeruleus]
MLNSPKSKKKIELAKTFKHLLLDSPYSDFPRSSSVSPHKFTKLKPNQTKNLPVDIEIPNLKNLEKPLILSPSNKRSRTPSNPHRFNETFKEKALRVIKEMPKKTERPKKPIRYSNISEIPEDFITISFTSLDSTPITDIEDQKYKSQTPKTMHINDKNNLTSKKSSTLKPKTEPRIEKSPTKRSASKTQDEHINYDITTSLKSQEVLANKFVKEYEIAVQNLNLQSENIDFGNTVTLLTILGFINNDPGSLTYDNEMHLVNKLWESLGGMMNIKVSSLLTMCLHIMNLYKANSYFTDEKCANIKTWVFMHGIHVYRHEEVLKIHKKYYEFYQNRSLGKKTCKNTEKNEESLLGVDRKSMFTRKNKSVSIKDELVENMNVKDRKFAHSPIAFRKSMNNPKFSMMLYKNNNEKHKDFYPDIEKSKVKEQSEGFYSEKVQKEIKRMRDYREQKAKKNDSLMNKSYIKNSSYLEEAFTESLHAKNNSLINRVNMLKLIKNPSRSKSSLCERKSEVQSVDKNENNVYIKDHDKKEKVFSNRIANKFLNCISEKVNIGNLSVSNSQYIKGSNKSSPRNNHHIKQLSYEKNIILEETPELKDHNSDIQVLPNHLSNEIHNNKATMSILGSLKEKIINNGSCESIKNVNCEDKIIIDKNPQYALSFKPQIDEKLLTENPEKLFYSQDMICIQKDHK